MRRAAVYHQDKLAGFLIEQGESKYAFHYTDEYAGPPISLTMPVVKRQFLFETFPPFFDGLLPEGTLLEALLKQAKIDRYDLFSQLVTVGNDLVGAVTVKEA